MTGPLIPISLLICLVQERKNLEGIIVPLCLEFICYKGVDYWTWREDGRRYGTRLTHLDQITEIYSV